ncbi:MAG: hypothetical protein JRI25_25130 [Deltaproteobacteria bacterium]|nr:hypothetical protein [Deltaproteobacteria bacterium]MBW2257864.1 hypothetical protein [Deltaproteobacteria bacterium]
MSWEDVPIRTGSRLPAPDDGIVSTLRPRGWLGNRWHEMLRTFDEKHQNRIARGRSFARSGRVRDLWFSPGLATAEVFDTAEHQVSVRLRVFEDSEWHRVVGILLADLRLVAAMLEGELPEVLVERLAEEGVNLVPLPDELGGDCDCGDFLLPCEHMAAVHHLLADALDGDPFLLPTLRGWNRDQLLGRLRASWGDHEPMRRVEARKDEDPPKGDWYRANPRVPAMRLDIHTARTTALGLRALGPPPGEADLAKALAPLYEAGGEAALALAFGEDESLEGRHAFRRHTASSDTIAPLEEDKMSNRNDADEQSLTEKVVDLLATMESAKSRELADRLQLTNVQVRNELLDLEKLGIVYRTGRTRGTRWWLG